MITKKCVQCGKNFTLSDSEVEFFNSKNLSIPKRCKECRKNNKSTGNGIKEKQVAKNYEGYYVIRNFSEREIAAIIIMFIITIATMATDAGTVIILLSFIASAVLVAGIFIYHFCNKIFIQEFDTSYYKYTFYDSKSMIAHYVKHYKETDCQSLENYLLKANLVIINKGTVSKNAKKNGDTVFYNPQTNEFVILAKAGYLRTYFIAGARYFDKQ